MDGTYGIRRVDGLEEGSDIQVVLAGNGGFAIH
jgi:hypothetical protein